MTKKKMAGFIYEFTISRIHEFPKFLFTIIYNSNASPKVHLWEMRILTTHCTVILILYGLIFQYQYLEECLGCQTLRKVLQILIMGSKIKWIRIRIFIAQPNFSPIFAKFSSSFHFWFSSTSKQTQNFHFLDKKMD